MPLHINYIGYVEGRDINRAKADVVVTDGFTGNVTLKTMEGFASFLLGNLREVFGSGLLRRLFYFFFFRSRIITIRQRLDPAEYGGAPLLGVNGVAIIAHGSSSARAIRNAVRAAANEALVRHVNSEIVDVLRATPLSLIAKPASARGIRGVLERVRERLHSRDTHGLKRSEAASEAAVHREGIQGKPENAPTARVTPRTGSIHTDSSRLDATNSRKPSAEKTALTNGLPSAAEPERDNADERADGDSRPVKPA
jgi:hypothetical protein